MRETFQSIITLRVDHGKEVPVEPLRQMFGHRLRNRDQLRAYRTGLRQRSKQTPEKHFGYERMKKKSSPLRRRRTPAPVASPATPGVPVNLSFPVVGIGASAGGLEALEHFLARVPKSSGMAFVIVQHLDPTRKGIMPELLQRTTSMRVIQEQEVIAISNSLYFIGEFTVSHE